jgi:rRNA maturation RNase YbeY
MSALIQFFSEGVSYRLEHEKDVQQWLHELIGQENLKAGVINYIFCNDEYLLELNQKFLERNTLTDVIAFDYREEENEVSGDVFISIERTRENAKKYNQAPENELLRVIVHGLLHLCGYDDRTPAQKEEMTLKEDKYLSLLTF